MQIQNSKDYVEPDADKNRHKRTVDESISTCTDSRNANITHSQTRKQMLLKMKQVPNKQKSKHCCLLFRNGYPAGAEESDLLYDMEEEYPEYLSI